MCRTREDSSQGVTMEQSGPAELQQRLDQINEIFGAMVSQAENLSQSRCPYRDRLDQCTAMFSCRNQEVAESGETVVLSCGHDGTFDFRTAWESQPRSQIKARERIEAIRSEAEERRRVNRSDPPEQ